MKRIKYIFMLGACAASALMSNSCADKVLDIDPTGWYSESTAYSSVSNLDMYVKGLYSVLYSNADIANGYIFDDGVTDLVKYSWWGVNGGTVNQMYYLDEIVTPEHNFRSNWGLYTHIRRLNEYFSDVSKGYADNIDKEALAVRTAEVRFLRAFAYQELVLRHGGVILRVDEDKVDGQKEKAKARSSEEECWSFIIDEYKKAEEALPASRSGDNAGRITKGAAIGMRARAALYAKRWNDAVTACNELFKLGTYSLVSGSTYSEYYRIFNTPYNSELILPVYFQQSNGGQSSKQHYFNQYFCPPGDGDAFNVKVGAAATPTDEYASEFEIKAGGKWQAFDWDDLSSYGNKPFDNREPRFYASILYNDESWRGRKLEIYKDGKDGYMDFKMTGQDNEHKSTTGYLFRKFISDDSKMNYTSILSGQYWIEMRLAEIYLIRSEAYARLGQFDKAYADLNEIRKRVGLPERAEKGSWEDYLADLEHERICELGMEGHRYFDLIRWGKAQKTINGKRLHGVKITPSGNGFKYQRVECDTQDRRFPEKYNIFPIPYDGLKNNALCKQNDLWL